MSRIASSVRRAPSSAPVLALLCALTACQSHPHHGSDPGQPGDDAGSQPRADGGQAHGEDAGDSTDGTDGGVTPPESDAATQPGELRVIVSPDIFCTGSCYEVRVGDSVQLVATDEHDAPVTPDGWSSDDAQIATTSSTGLVTGVAPGDVQIRATLAGKSGAATIHVVARPVSKIVVEPADVALDQAGDTVMLTARAYDDREQLVADAQISWFSANTQVANVDEAGKLTATGKGAGMVWASAMGGGEGSARVTVGDTLVPDAPGLALTAFAGAMDHDCGLDAQGHAYCWGWNYWGQLGTGNQGSESEYFPTPLAVLGEHVFHGITGSTSHTCALDDADSAYCWGSNGSGELGISDPDIGGTTLPFAVEGGHQFSQISAGYDHTCAVEKGTGKARCFGMNQYGALGDGSFDDRNQPTPVLGDLTFSSVRAGYVSSCGLTTSGKAYCWGANDYGQIGDGSDGETAAYETPQAVTGDHTFVALDLLSSHVCAITAEGAAFCWGRNDDGQLGDGSESPGASTPVEVASLVPFVQITVGVWHSCGLTAEGDAWCWGLNHSGQLGDGSISSSLAPVKVVGGLTFASIEAGGFHTCGITRGGQGYCWGENGDGRLGSGFGGDGSLSIVPWPVAAPEGP